MMTCRIWALDGFALFTAGSVITAAPAGGSPFDTKYCMDGNALHLPSVDSTTGEISADIVATR
jgi:hypothetical protein